MKLYQTFSSPFPTRVRLALYFKGIEFEIIEPPGFGASLLPKGDYLKLNPLGRVPTLVLDDGRALPESEVICEYLEEAFPTPALLPTGVWARSQVRLLTRISDVYLVMAMVPLFELLELPVQQWDAGKIDAAFAKIVTALSALEFYVGVDGYAVGSGLSFADGTLAPMLILVDEWAPQTFRRDSPLPDFPKLSAYWQRLQTNAWIARIVQETRDAIARRQAERARSTA